MAKERSRELRKILLLVGIAITSFLIVYLRDPTVFTDAQFWGEDGIYWYGQAYNDGPIRALISPYAASLQVGMRVVGALSLLIPFRLVPLFFATSATLVQILPVALLFTDRFKRLVKSQKIAIALATLYLLLPNSFEVNANLTNMNWHLALLAIMVVLKPGITRAWKIFDYVILLVSGLTGPFVIMLAPIALWLYRKNKLAISYLSVIAGTGAIQVIVYVLTASGSRFSQGLGASPAAFLAVVGARITGALVVGMEVVSQYAVEYRHWFALLGLATVAFLAYILVKAPQPLKLFVAFTWIVFVVAMIKPQATEILPQWQGMLDGAGNRYFWLPMLSLGASLIWSAFNSPKILRIASWALLASTVIIAVPKDFSYAPKPSKGFIDSAARYQQAQPGQTVCLDVNPSPDWRTCLQKR